MNDFCDFVDSLVERTGKLVSYGVWIGAGILFFEVIARHLFNAPTVWAHGYTQRVFGSYFILIGAYTLLKGGHVRIDLIISSFSFRIQKVFDLLNLTLLLIWCCALIYEGTKFFQQSWQVREVDEMVLGHPVYPVKFLLIVGAVLLALQGMSLLYRDVVKLIRGGGDDV